MTYINVPHEVCGGQREVDVLRQGELLSDPPSGEHGGGLRVLRRITPEEAVNNEQCRHRGLYRIFIMLLITELLSTLK